MIDLKMFIIIIIINSIITVTQSVLECDSKIFCSGKILDVVQNSYLFPDSKTFVDMRLKYLPEEVEKRFFDMMSKHKNDPARKFVKQFVDECFSPPGSEFAKFQPSDWHEKPKFINAIQDSRLKAWAEELHKLWKLLGRKMTEDVKNHPELYSILYVPNPVIVPGGRFREFYYWDSYWITLGLLHSEMTETVKGMLENFILILNKYGLVPNGGRLYYTGRSQPPLLIPMVKNYYDFTADKSFIETHINSLEAEFKYWMNTHILEVSTGNKKVKLAHYKVNTTGPRPESYREDVNSAKRLKSETEKNQFYKEIKAACESGMDFSTRWYIKQGANKGNLTNTKTSSIIPVDLNSILYWNAKLLAGFYKIIGNERKEAEYKKIADKWKQAIEELLWSESDGIWYDYDVLSKKKREYFYLSNLNPLWTGCYDQNKTNEIANKVVDYLEKLEVKTYQGGIPTSFETSGEQWDFPNAWPPLEHIAILGLNSTGNKRAIELANQLAKNWIRSNYQGFITTNAMFEKYDAEVVGGYGAGGEYAVQLGFGWSNGVCLDLLTKFGSKIDTQGINAAVKYNQLRSVIILFNFLIIFIL